VRTLTADCRLTEPEEFTFEVKAAWYASTPAWGIYFILLIALILIIRRKIKLRILRQERKVQEEAEAHASLEKQKSEQEIISLQNEKLQAEIAHKNIQLANSTMALIRKNELLIQIKEEIERLVENSGKKSLEQKSTHALSLINQNISSDADWTIFEALFDQAHENFFKRLKNAFPDLTQSDLKLCAYLKLNLSSKEIAPLLNITFRGVETRRYRLRRRLMLDSDENLVQFIMNF
jgi:cell division protein FtsI/penicillin-binding protein 2